MVLCSPDIETKPYKPLIQTRLTMMCSWNGIADIQYFLQFQITFCLFFQMIFAEALYHIEEVLFFLHRSSSLYSRRALKYK